MTVNYIQNNSRIQPSDIFAHSEVNACQVKDLYSSTLMSARNRPLSLGEFVGQLLETAALLAMLPFFIFIFFVASTWLLLFPVFMIFIPLMIINELMWEMLHAILPCFFPHPGHRGVYY